MPSVVNHSSSYRLADHVHACGFDGQVVLLDARRNKYLGIGGAQLAALSQCIAGWPQAAPGQASPALRASIDKFLKPLLDQQMLTTVSVACPPSLVLEEPRESLDIWQARAESSSTWRDLLRMARCNAVTAILLKQRCLADVAIGIRRLRPQDQACRPQADSSEMHAAVATYMRLRPFLFTAHDQCLHDSLTLVRFLAAKQLFPRWAIGVRTRPFAAHSWVQSGSTVLNDTHEHVRDYRPILVV